MFAPLLEAALSGGDVASVLIAPEVTSEAALQRIAETLVPIAQAAGAAALVLEDSRAVGRSKADGIHVEGGETALKEALDAFHPQAIVGSGNVRTRHDAMSAAEAGADYVFFGLLDRPDDADTHQKTLDFARWWAELFEPPCVALAGTGAAAVEAAALTGTDFVAVRDFVWQHPDGPAEAVRAANAILERCAGGAAR